MGRSYTLVVVKIIMKKMKIMKKIILLFSFVILFLGIFVFYLFPIQAMIVPQVYFTNLTIDKINFNPGDIITGTVSLWNYEQFVISDLVFNFQLLGDEVDGVPTKMINSQMDSNIFQLSSGEETDKSFSYTLPSNLPTGNFVFRIQLSNSRGEEMSWEDKIITIGGENKFLTLGNYWIVKDGVKLSPGGGVDYKSGEIPEIIFDVNNDSNFTVVAFPKIITYKRNQGQFLQENKGADIILKPEQKQTIEAFLPQLTDPESYLSEVRLYDTETEEEISSLIYFRWIISGQDDAEILYVNPDKDSYEAGEEAEIDIQITGPAHTYSEDTHLIPAEEGVVEVSLFNQEDELMCQGNQEVSLESGQVSVSCVVSEDLVNPKIETKIIKNDKILDDYKFEVESKNIPSEGSSEEKISFFEKNKKIILFIFIGFILIMIIIFYFKNRKGSLSVLILLILFSMGILFNTNNVFAATEVDGGLCDTTIAFNKPVPNHTYNGGDVINFSGKFRVTSCGDGLFFNKITFYIAEDKEIPLTTANACNGCLGATSSGYPQSTCSCGWCNQIQVLQENNSNFKVYKLGTIYPSDIASGAKPYWVEYNQNFIIPDNLDGLGFSSGPVRFYVQYSGTHWNSHWHWNITYQPGFLNINNPPTVNNLSVLKGDCCSNPSYHLSWTYSDPDSDTQSRFGFQADNNSNFSSPTVNRDILNLSNPSPTINNQTIVVSTSPDTPGSNQFAYGTTYYWQVIVYDNQGANSGWVNGSSFITPRHRYPTVDFNWSPNQPSQDEDVQFTDQSVVYGEASKSSWSWAFLDGTPGSSSTQNPIIKFLSQGIKTVTLQITDSSGYTCSKTENVNVNIKLPGWEEVIPW